MKVVENDAVKGYVERVLGIEITQPHRVLGFVSNDDRPLCAVVLNDFNGSNLELTICAEPGGLTRGVVRYLARYAFEQLGCRRLTVRTKRRNKRALAMAPRFGFRFEACAKRYFADDDAVVFRMLKDECRWLT